MAIHPERLNIKTGDKTIVKEYILKHRNDIVLEFKINEGTKDVECVNIINDKYSPVNLNGSDVAKAISFNNWIINRWCNMDRYHTSRHYLWHLWHPFYSMGRWR